MHPIPEVLQDDGTSTYPTSVSGGECTETEPSVDETVNPPWKRQLLDRDDDDFNIEEASIDSDSVHKDGIHEDAPPLRCKQLKGKIMN